MPTKLEAEISKVAQSIRALKPSHPLKLAVASIEATAPIEATQREALALLKLLHRRASKSAAVVAGTPGT